MSKGTTNSSSVNDEPTLTLKIPIPTEGFTVVRPRPGIVTERNCEKEHAISKRLLLKASRNGLKHTRTPDGVTCLFSDLETWLSERGTTVANVVRPEPTNSDLDEVDLVLLQAGGRLGRQP